VKIRERVFERSQGRPNLVEFVSAAELLQLKSRVDGGARAEVGNRSLQPVGRALESPGVAGGQGPVNLVQSARVFVQKERGDLFEQVQVPADSSQRRSAIQDLFL